MKMLRDCGLLYGQSVLNQKLSEEKRIRQIHSVEVDLLFKQVCKQVSATKAAYSTLNNIV